MAFNHNWAFIQNGVCTNMAYFEAEENVNDFKTAAEGFNMYDELVLEEPGFWIGDLYSNGVWSHPVTPVVEEEPTEQSAVVEE